ncbi:MAG TPA: hypothetical protein P5246_00715, partial [Candidatus Omnitrophota bacterium]|nr:hypothetical protein [Candidatus Omnitrophota bacterium]
MPGIFDLPVPGTMIGFSEGFAPPIIRGLALDPQNPLKFDFIIDTGDENLQGEAFKDEAQKLIKYFLASLTVPDEEFWVNLSPYEEGRIIADGLGVTEMGRDLLAQDYILKQLASSLMFPEKELGKEFWQRVFKKAQERFGTTDIPVQTFNKIWIVPDKAVVYEHSGYAFVGERHLKVMVEEDYFALTSNQQAQTVSAEAVGEEGKDVNSLSSEIVREILIPEIEKEVNEGKQFANLRQIYNSVILAAWYKRNLKDSLLGQVYVNKNKIRGIDLDDKAAKEKIYEQYMAAIKKGVFNFIKEDVDPVSQQVIPRKYFSGGLGSGVATPQRISVRPLVDQAGRVNSAVLSTESRNPQARLQRTAVALVENTGAQELAAAVRSATNAAVTEAQSLLVGQLQEFTKRIKAGEKNLRDARADLAVEYVSERLGERIVDGRTVGNNEIVAIVESYIRDEERTDIQTLLLEGEYTDKVIDVLSTISEMASRTLIESMTGGVEGRGIQASQADLEAYIPLLKQKSSFYMAEEVARFKNQAEYWKAEEEWIKHRKTTNPRWSKFRADGKAKNYEQEREDAEILLTYASQNLEPVLVEVLGAFVEEAGLAGEFANISYRTKGIESSLDKLGRLRSAPWAQGKDVSLADLVDLLGGRIVVDDLRSLEKLMNAVEKVIAEKQDDPRFKGMRILRKENKFIANDGKPDPYRAVQYTITFPGADGEQFTFELQLKTFSAMVASDLFHNAVYKAEVLNLPGDLQQVVRDYNWRSDVEETKAYLGKSAEGVESGALTYEQEIEKAVAERNFNRFFDLVLSRIDERTFSNKAEWIRTFDRVNALLNKEIEFLNELHRVHPEAIQILAKASHDNGYYLTPDVAGYDGKSGIIHDPTTVALVPELSAEAVGLLSERGREFYNNRYENFKGNNNKLTVGQLDLQSLSLEDLVEFFHRAGKDIRSKSVVDLISGIMSLKGLSSEQLVEKSAKQILNKPLINLYHQRFDDMEAKGKTINNDQAQMKWFEAIINNQLRAIAVSVLLTEIGGKREDGATRDLGEPAFPGTQFSLREKLIHEFWVFALQWNGEYAYDGRGREAQAITLEMLSGHDWGDFSAEDILSGLVDKKHVDPEGWGALGFKALDPELKTRWGDDIAQRVERIIKLTNGADPEGWRTADPEGRGVLDYRNFVTTLDKDGLVKFRNQINLDRTIDVAILRALTE